MSTSPTDPPAPVPSASNPSENTGGGAGAAPTGPRRAKGCKLVRHFKVDHLLAPQHRTAYEALLLDPRQTADSLLKWLNDHGYSVSRAGVARHRRQFELDVKDVRRDARVAAQFAALARAGGGATALTDAGQFRLEQMFFEQLFRMEKTERRGGKEWLELARTMSSLLGSRGQVEQQRLEWERRAKEAAEAVEKAAGEKKPLDGVAVANAVRRILGVPLPGQPLPPLPDGEPSTALIDVPHDRMPRRLPSPSDN